MWHQPSTLGRLPLIHREIAISILWDTTTEDHRDSPGGHKAVHKQRLKCLWNSTPAYYLQLPCVLFSRCICRSLWVTILKKYSSSSPPKSHVKGTGRDTRHTVTLGSWVVVRWRSDNASCLVIVPCTNWTFGGWCAKNRPPLHLSQCVVSSSSCSSQSQDDDDDDDGDDDGFANNRQLHSERG